MLGKVEYDETRVGYITTWIPGRIDRLFVDYTGISVKKGDHLVEIYSPDLYTAQEELIQALKAVEELKDSKLSTARKTALRTVESSREKLRLLGLTDEQIQKFEKLVLHMLGRMARDLPVGEQPAHLTRSSNIKSQFNIPFY